MAAKKPVAKKERRSKGGLKDKIDWVEAQFANKNLSRADAVHGLLKKYPEMALNYARAIVYSYMKDYKFAKAVRKSKSPAAKKTTAKKSASTKSKTPAKKKAAPKRGSKDEEDMEDIF